MTDIAMDRLRTRQSEQTAGQMVAGRVPMCSRRCAVAGGRPVVVCCLVIVLAGCAQDQPAAAVPAAKQPLPTLKAELLTVTPQHWPSMVRTHGSLIPDDVAVVGSRIEGRVDDVHIDLGDTVTTGSPLVTVSQQEFRLRVQQAEAQLMQARAAVGLKAGDPVDKLDPQNAPPVLEQKAVWNEAQASLQRARALEGRNAITPSELEQIQATAAVAEARFRSALNGVQEKIALIGVRESELSLAQEALNNTVLVAPFEGFVQQKQVSPGTYVRVGDSVATIVRTNRLRFRGTVPERLATALSVGQSIELQMESVADVIEATVSRISPAIDLTSRALLFEAVIDNREGHLRSGLFAEARIVTDPEATAIVVPTSALVEFAGVQKVWLVRDGQAHEQQVLTGERRDIGIQILEGLQDGDVILQDGSIGIVAIIE